MLLLLPLFASIAVVFLAVTFWVGRRIGAPWRTAVVALTVLGATWLGALTLMLAGWKDTDGWIDCNDYCHGWHYFGAFMFWTPLVAGLLFLTVLIPKAVAAALSWLDSNQGPDAHSD